MQREWTSAYWLNPSPKDQQEFDYQVETVCEGIYVVSLDEKTGIQALERAYPTEQMQPGLVERQEARVWAEWHYLLDG